MSIAHRCASQPGEEKKETHCDRCVVKQSLYHTKRPSAVCQTMTIERQKNVTFFPFLSFFLLFNETSRSTGADQRQQIG